MIKKEPLVRIAKRNDATLKQKIVMKTVCIGTAVLISILFIWIVSGKNPFPAVGYIFTGTFQNSIKIWASVQETALLLGIALALTPAYKMRFWNIGAQGQILMGGLMTAVSMIYFKTLMPNALVIICGLLLGTLAGGFWAFIPGFFKAKFNTNETLFTLMMNYIAVLIVTIFAKIWQGSASSLGLINSRGTYKHIGWLLTINDNPVIVPLICVLFLAVSTYVYFKKTKHGYETEVVGESVKTAKYTGINVPKVMMRTVALSGALCGIIGFFYVAGIDHTISASTSGSYGFTAIIVAWLSKFNPFVMIFYAFLIVFLNQGGKNLSDQAYSANLNEYSCEFIVFIIILSILLSEFFTNYVLIYRDRNKFKKYYLHQLITFGLTTKEVK
jgi:simple sugar transport system permease protein